MMGIASSSSSGSWGRAEFGIPIFKAGVCCGEELG